MKEKVLDARLEEITAREKIVAGLRELNLGIRTTREFPEKELGYSPLEARAILATLGLILTREAMISEDPRVQTRIERLHEWRRSRAKRDGLPAYRVLSNRVLMAIASECPKSSESLRELKGFGPRSAEVYGTELLALLEC